jgi:hypothetical protein
MVRTMKEHTQMENRTIDITNMPKDYLNDYLSGRLSFDEVYSLYPGPDD